MLHQHDDAEPVGVWDEITEDAQGLLVRGRILRTTARGRLVAALVEAGAPGRPLHRLPRREGPPRRDRPPARADGGGAVGGVDRDVPDAAGRAADARRLTGILPLWREAARMGRWGSRPAMADSPLRRPGSGPGRHLPIGEDLFPDHFPKPEIPMKETKQAAGLARGPRGAARGAGRVRGLQGRQRPTARGAGDQARRRAAGGEGRPHRRGRLQRPGAAGSRAGRRPAAFDRR